MFARIAALKEKGFYPDAILDIGACHGTWTNGVRTIYTCPYYLFEGIDYPQLSQMQSESIKVYNVILNDKAEEVNWYQKKNIGDSMFREKTHFYANCDVLKRQTIDLNTHIQKEGILQDAKNIFIKIDCQGAEIPILKGASSILHRTDFILLEIPFFGQYNEGVPSFLEHIAFMDSIGFTVFDIAELHYINGFNMQIDMLFINKNHALTKRVNEVLV